MRLATISASLLVAATLVAEEPAAQFVKSPTVRINPSTRIPLPSLSSVRLYVSRDRGASWTMVLEQAVPPNAAEVPGFTYEAPADGVYAFATQVVPKPGMGSGEQAPQNGSALAVNHLVVNIDTHAPSFSAFTATAGARGDGVLPVRLAWTSSDANPAAAPVSLQLSRDQGRTWQPLRDGAQPASGEVEVEVPFTAETTLVVRAQAADLAGNLGLSAPREVAIPAPPDPAAALATAVAALLPPERLAREEKPVEKTIEKPVEKPVETAVSRGTTPAAPPVAVEQPEALEPNAIPGAVRPEPELVTNDPVEDAFVRAQLGQREPAREPEVPAALTPPADTPWLDAAAAQQMFDNARALRLSDPRAALPLLLRLQRSALAPQAVALHLDTLRRIGAHRELVGIVANLPVELHDDNARIEAAQAFNALKDYDAAVHELAPIRNASPRAREGMLHLGDALVGLGRTTDATRLFRAVAAGDDELAAAAQQRLGGK